MRSSLALVVLVLGCAPAPVTSPSADGGCLDAPRVFANVVENARDLGGSPGVRCGQLFRGAVPSAQPVCASFANAGVKTVIDLRVPSERQGDPDAACLSTQASMVLAPMPIPYNVSPSDYLADLDSPAVRTVFAQLGDASAYPLFFHCTYGRDRSGVVAALILSSLGVSREDILRDYQRTTEDGLRTTPASLEAVLDEVDRRGGIEAHLTAIGVTPAELATLRAQGH